MLGVWSLWKEGAGLLLWVRGVGCSALLPGMGSRGVSLGMSCHAPQGHRGAGETPTPVFPEGITAFLGAKKILLVKSVQLQVKSKYDDFILVRAASHTASL